MVNNEFQFKIAQTQDFIGYALFMFRDLPQGGREFVKSDGTIETVQMGAVVDKPLHLATFRDLGALKSLVEQANDMGIRPDANARLEGELKATKQHLFDMRAITYKHEGLMFEADAKERPKS